MYRREKYTLEKIIILTTTHPWYVERDGEIREETTQVTAHKIPLIEIRSELLKRHEELRLIRQYPDEYYETLTVEQIKKRLFELHEQLSVSSERNSRK